MSDSLRILVVEDLESEREALTRLLRMEDFDVVAADSPQQALQHLNERIDLVISDVRMGSASGIDLLREWRSQRQQTPFVMLTAYGDARTAVEAMKLGAEEYLSKPVYPEELLLLIHRCLNARKKDQTIGRLQQRLDQLLGFENIIGNSPAMTTVFNNARRAAATDSTVLITGESGTGKELIAEAIHQNSPRKQGPFVVVNMAAVPEHLVESELFGHIKGAFTGATDSRIGRFEAAHGGTLFIDEIGDFKLESQAKLLRVFESHYVTPVGCNQDRQVDVRVVAATSRRLEDLVEAGQFREDLYYRLNVINLRLPALRERREDIPLLIHHFLSQFSQSLKREPISLELELKRYLESHAWPGNVRQLRNCLESMVVLAPANSLTMADVPVTMNNGPLNGQHHVSIPPGTRLEDLEREAVEQALEQHGGNRTHAARALGISVRTLQRKRKAWGLTDNGNHTL